MHLQYLGHRGHNGHLLYQNAFVQEWAKNTGPITMILGGNTLWACLRNSLVFQRCDEKGSCARCMNVIFPGQMLYIIIVVFQFLPCYLKDVSILKK